jgi:tetratricopeptide (TPR) repeat protein
MWDHRASAFSSLRNGSGGCSFLWVLCQPNSARAHYNLGSAIIAGSSDGRERRALSSFLRTLSIDPTSDEAWNNAAATYEGLGQHDRAATAYEALSALRGYDDSYAVNAVGRALAAQGKGAEAAVKFEGAIALGEEQGQCQAHALFNLAKLRGEGGGALELYTAAAACDPSYRGAREAAGAALHGARRSGEAVQHFEAALELLGDGADRTRALSNLGGVLAAAGRGAEAVALLEGALQEAERNGAATEDLQRNLEAAKRRLSRSNK